MVKQMFYCASAGPVVGRKALAGVMKRFPVPPRSPSDSAFLLRRRTAWDSAPRQEGRSLAGVTLADAVVVDDSYRGIGCLVSVPSVCLHVRANQTNRRRKGDEAAIALQNASLLFIPLSLFVPSLFFYRRLHCAVAVFLFFFLFFLREGGMNCM